MIRPTLVLLALAGAGVALPAAAQTTTRAAMLAQLRAEFAATDINRDGVVTRQEAEARFDHMKVAGAAHGLTQAQARELAALWFQSTDLNHDGRVTLDEAEATAGQVFDRYDINHDGVISPAERAAARARLKRQVPVPNGR